MGECFLLGTFIINPYDEAAMDAATGNELRRIEKSLDELIVAALLMSVGDRRVPKSSLLKALAIADAVLDGLNAHEQTPQDISEAAYFVERNCAQDDILPPHLQDSLKRLFGIGIEYRNDLPIIHHVAHRNLYKDGGAGTEQLNDVYANERDYAQVLEALGDLRPALELILNCVPNAMSRRISLR